MLATPIAPPRCWNHTVKSAMLATIALAQYTFTHVCGRTAQRTDVRQRRKLAKYRHVRELSLAREEMRIKDARMARIPPHQRPRYAPQERLAILELKAARGWSLAQTANRFQVTPATISSWQRRVDEEGPEALVQLPRPVNKYPQFVAYLVRRLKTVCPALGKRKIAEMLAHAGLHLGATTVGRILRHKPRPTPLRFSRADEVAAPRVVTAKRPNHVWHVDLTIVPIVSGFWTTWLPCALPQCWPFCWWVAVVVDHISRRAMGTASFAKQPTSEEVRAFLGRAIHVIQATPKYIICDRGRQFDCAAFRRWCRRRKIQPRYGAIGQHGSIAVVERFILTLKECCTRRLLLTPLRSRSFRQELSLFSEWYNRFRPHTTLSGRTPDEAYFKRFPKCRKPRFEPRSRWPRGSPCAKPWALTRNGPGARLELDVNVPRRPEASANRGHSPRCLAHRSWRLKCALR